MDIWIEAGVLSFGASVEDFAQYVEEIVVRKRPQPPSTPEQ